MDLDHDVGWLVEQTARSGYMPALSQRVSPITFPQSTEPHGDVGTRVSWSVGLDLGAVSIINHLGSAEKLDPINVNAALRHGIAG